MWAGNSKAVATAQSTPSTASKASTGRLNAGVWVFVAGSVSVQSGRRQIGELSDGDCFGETGYVRGARRTATISATTPVTLVRVSSTLLEQSSSACQLRFNKVFLRSLIERLQGVVGATS